ncbi:hypothetical protein ACF0H5_016101 [Mactra antiquata]
MVLTSRPSNYNLRSSPEEQVEEVENPVQQVQINSPASIDENNIMAGIFKLESYSGSQDIKSFLNRFDQYCKCVGISGERAMATLAWSLEGNARVWFENLEPQPNSLEDLKAKLLSKYKKTEMVNLQIYASKQLQTETTEEFITRLEVDCIKHKVPENVAVQIALNGIDHSIGAAISTHVPETIDDVRKILGRIGHLQKKEEVNTTIPSKLETTVDVLTSAVAKLAASVQDQRQPCRRCGVQVQMMLTALLMAMCFTTVSGISLSELQRLNYGVAFEPRVQLQTSEEMWIHTFEVELPTGMNMIDLSVCKDNRAICKFVNDVLLEINQIRHKTEVVLNSTIESVYKLVPKKQLNVRSRSRRAILSFIGDLSKSIFGTATVEDVRTLANHINALNKITSKVVSTVEQHEENLASYIQTSDERMSNIMEGLKTNELAIENIQQQLYETFGNLEKAFSTISTLMAKQIENSRQIEHRFQEIWDGINDLVEGKLSPKLIPANTMSKTVKDIQQILNDKFQGFHLVYTDISEIYKNVQSLYNRKGSKLYIALKFPISPFQKPLTLFNVLSFPVPVNDSTNHATQIIDSPKLFAMTDDSQFYVTFEQEEILSCQADNSNKLLCTINKVLTPITTPSCILGLFHNDKVIVKQLCDFRFLVNHINPNIFVLSKTTIVVYKLDTLDFTCNSSKRMLNGCSFCTLSVPCQCSISAKGIYLPQRLSDCQENSITKLHPFNLAVLQQFFNDTSLESIESNMVFENPLDITVPQFKLYNHSMNNIIADDRKTHLSLQKMAQAAKSDATAFRTLTEPLLAGRINIDNSWPSTDDIILYCTSAVAGFSLFLCIIMFTKLRKVCTIIAVLQSSKQVSAANVPSFVYKNKNPVNTNEPNFFGALDLTIDHYILALSIATFICLLSHFVFFIKNYNRQTKLVVELTNGKCCIHVSLKTLSLCPTYWKAQVPNNITCISIRGLLNPVLSFDWDHCSITNKLNEQSISIDKQHCVSMLSSQKIRKILSTTYCVYFYFQHGNIMIPISNHSP